MELNSQLGSITPSKLANLIITSEVSSIAELPYSFGHNWIDQVIISGKVL
jgi:imidazolonepropionase